MPLPHSTRVQVRFADIDVMGHVNHAIFLAYMELARIHYFNEVVGTSVNWSETGIIIARATVDYFNPVFLADEWLIVRTACSRFGNKSFDLKYEVVKEKTGEKAAEGITAVVCYNYRQRETIQVPEEWKEKIKKFKNHI